MDASAKDVIVAGGGISGLTVAWHLKKAGINVALLEANDQVGGCMRTEHRDGFLLEKGPFNVIVRDPAFEELLGDLSDKLTVVTASREARARFIYRKKRLMAVPTNPASLLFSPLLSLGAKCRMILGLLASRRPSSPEWSIEDFAVRRLGREVSDTMVSAVISGIIAGDIRKLSLNACYPSIARFDGHARSPVAYGLSRALQKMLPGNKGEKRRRRWRGLVSIDRGLGAITEAIGKTLGDNLHTDCRVQSVEHGPDGFTLSCRNGDGNKHAFRCNRLVVALPVAAAGQLLAPLVPEAADIMNGIESASLTVLNLAFRVRDVGHPMQGFGFLVPHNETEFPLMGVLWADSAFPHHGKQGHRLIRVFMGGIRTPDVISRSADELVETTRRALRDLLGITGEPTLIDVCPYPAAIPQYHFGHRQRIERLKTAVAAVPGLHLAGNYIEGVSVNDCVRVGKKVAETVIHG
ncbi:MAG: protoporphyrinogen oxidase [Phycisphaerae bacterium]